MFHDASLRADFQYESEPLDSILRPISGQVKQRSADLLITGQFESFRCHNRQTRRGCKKSPSLPDTTS
ncbi:MAG: hypothetical protein JKY95_16960 [Planctomycetaceae bacterium]|nr:hypothetical protein [Planctomycetaceae bacterium]